MLNTSSTAQADELAVRNQETEVEIGNEVVPSGRIVFPPVPQLLKGQRVPSRAEPVKPSGRRHLPDEAIQTELSRLLRRYDEFRNSETYLTRVASLAVLCGQLDRAYNFAVDAVRLNPSGDSRYRLAEIASYRSDLQTAETVWRELSEEGHLLAILRLAELAVGRLDLEQARDWLNRAIEIDETDWRVQAFAGTLALVLGEHATAVRYFRTAREERPNSTRLYYNLALAHVFSNHTKHALKALRVAVGLNPFGQKALVAWADLSIQSREGMAEASNALARYTDLYAEDGSAIDRLAHLYYLQGDLRGTRRVLTAACRRFDDPSIINNLGVLAVSNKDLRLAVSEFSRAARLAAEAEEPSGEEITDIATANLVTALINAKEFEQAEQVADDYIRLTTDNRHLTQEPTFHIAEGLVGACLNLGKANKAVVLAEEWIAQSIHLKLRTSLANTLVCYYSLVKKDLQRAYEFAVQAYDAQAESETRDLKVWSIALNNLAFVAIERGLLKEAAQYAARLQAQIPRQAPYVYATRGLLAIRLGQAKRGEGLYRLAISSAPDRGTKSLLRLKLNWELANYWVSQSETQRAVRMLEKVLQTRVTGVWTMPYVKQQATRLLKRLRAGG